MNFYFENKTEAGKRCISMKVKSELPTNHTKLTTQLICSQYVIKNLPQVIKFCTYSRLFEYGSFRYPLIHKCEIKALPYVACLELPNLDVFPVSLVMIHNQMFTDYRKKLDFTNFLSRLRHN